MSDLSELFNPNKSDPKALTWDQFVQKEEGNIATAFKNLPTIIQPFVQETAPALAALSSALIQSGGGAVGAILAAELPTLEAWIADVFTKAGVSAATPVGQDAIKTIVNATVATVNTVATRASNGITTVASGVNGK